MNWRRNFRFWLAALPADRPGVVIMTGFLIVLAVGLIVIPHLTGWTAAGGRTNWGFGPDWTCQRYGKGEPVCLKKTPTPATGSTQITNRP